MIVPFLILASILSTAVAIVFGLAWFFDKALREDGL